MSHSILHRAVAPGVASSAGATVTTWFITRRPMTLAVPSGVTSMDVDAVGEGGQGSYRTQGGGAARAQSTLTVSPGENLTVNVNVGGGAGGTSTYPGGKGGGYAGILRSATPLVIAAGGGAGSTTDSGGAGNRFGSGGAGGSVGADGIQSDAVPYSNPGAGATASAGGAGGSGGAGTGPDGASGSALTGGAGGSGSAEGGGGGGAGLYGGGGGESVDSGGENAAGGGGGSSLGSTVTGGSAITAASNPYGAGLGGNPTYATSTPVSAPYNTSGASGVVRVEWSQAGIEAPPDVYALDTLKHIWVARHLEGTSYPEAFTLMYEDAAGLSAGDPVPLWPDAKGGLSLSQGALANQPTAETSGSPGGKFAVYFDGSAFLKSESVALTAENIIVIVYADNVSSNFTVPFDHGNTLSGAGGTLLGLRRSSAGSIIYNKRGSTYAYLSGLLDSTPPSAYEAHVFTTDTTGAGQAYTVDGVDKSTGNSGSLTDYNLANVITVGQSGSAAYKCTGYMLGMAILDASATAQDVADVVAYIEGD